MANRLGLRARLMAFVLVPSLLLGALVLERGLVKRAGAREADELSLLVKLAVIVGDLVHETQRERGSSSVFMSSRGTRFAAELQAQRTLTDDRRVKYLQFVRANDPSWPPQVSAALRMTDSQLTEIEARRRQVTDLSAPVPEVIGYYNDLNRRLLDSVASIASKSGDAELRGWSTAYFAFLQAKEHTGMERAQLSNVFGADHFSPGQYFTVASLLAAQRTYLHMFTIGAPARVVQLYRQKSETPVFAEVEARERLAFGSGPPVGERAGFGVDSTEWYKLMTRKIDLLKEVENATASAILLRAEGLARDATVAFRETLVVGLALFLMVVAGGWAVAHRIVDPLRRLRAVADRICAGELDHQIDTTAPAEVGELALSFQRMVNALKSMGAHHRKLVPGRSSGSRAVLP
jgi:methyl-accepting chemotaxis protein